MNNISIQKEQLAQDGFTVIENIFSEKEVEQILECINNIDTSRPTFRKTNDLFAIRQFLKEIPSIKALVFNDSFKQLLRIIADENYFLIKSIYFDKPEQSNWFVPYHQDLTISVDQKKPIEGYGPWTAKHDQFAVQPPLDILQNIYTFRIHLDDTDEQNGALKVIPGSQAKGIYRPEQIDWENEKEVFCRLGKGSVMLMRPLLLHASNKTTNQHKRRVIHLEFASMELPPGIQWAERLAV